MEPSFWKTRWREGRIGFHEGKPNDLLVAHADLLPAGSRVFVPLCGKAEDMAFLAGRGHEVVGVELAESAVQGFFAEHELSPEVSRRGPFQVFSAGGVTVLQGDIFDTTPAHVGVVTALYDR